jgi:hypothetical protein
LPQTLVLSEIPAKLRARVEEMGKVLWNYGVSAFNPVEEDFIVLAVGSN